MTTTDHSAEHYRHLARQEQALGEQVNNAEIADLHRRLAERYRELAEEAKAAGR